MKHWIKGIYLFNLGNRVPIEDLRIRTRNLGYAESIYIIHVDAMTPFGDYPIQYFIDKFSTAGVKK